MLRESQYNIMDIFHTENLIPLLWVIPFGFFIMLQFYAPENPWEVKDEPQDDDQANALWFQFVWAQMYLLFEAERTYSETTYE